jgi:hypothetical protein
MKRTEKTMTKMLNIPENVNSGAVSPLTDSENLKKTLQDSMASKSIKMTILTLLHKHCKKFKKFSHVLLTV